MRVLQNVTPTPEQYQIIQKVALGAVVIRGAAGSGKTTTALLRMKYIAAAWKRRHVRLAIQRPVEMLVITFNKTLRGYIEELAKQELAQDAQLCIAVKTWSKWAVELYEIPVQHALSERYLQQLSMQFGSQAEFVRDEVQYIVGRFPPEQLSDYLDCERRGRGRLPRCDRPLREQILEKVVYPLQRWKTQHNIVDFDDLAAKLAQVMEPLCLYDVIVVDEAQDLSANEIRALLNHLQPDHSITFVLDGAQRIYSKGFTWREVGINLQSNQSYRLLNNYRNTVEIAAFIRPILEGVDIGEEDGNIPNLDRCEQHGQKPVVIVGYYRQQLDWCINYLKAHVDLNEEPVAFLKPYGGGYFNALRSRLTQEGIPFVELTRVEEWPSGPENIALSTMHSAKGLEFDHILLIGLNDEVTPHGSEVGDNRTDVQRRLFAMAAARARKRLIIGYKPSEASILVNFFADGTFDEITL